MGNKIAIKYCKQCRWMLRASWMSQELLTTFSEEIEELSLLPGTGGVFKVFANGKEVWCRKQQHGFPTITVLKQLVRDEIAPEKSLGHSDKKK